MSIIDPWLGEGAAPVALGRRLGRRLSGMGTRPFVSLFGCEATAAGFLDGDGDGLGMFSMLPLHVAVQQVPPGEGGRAQITRV